MEYYNNIDIIFNCIDFYQELCLQFKIWNKLFTWITQQLPHWIPKF